MAMNDQNGKKRRLGDDDVDDSPTISSAEVMRMMKTMQEEIDSMKHRMNEMDGQLVQKTEEINSMKHKMIEMECQLLKTDQIESECNELRSHNANVVVPLLSQIAQATAQISTANEIAVKALDDMKEMAKSTKNSLRYHRQLIDNTRWEYSAEPIANSYWIDNGYDQDDIGHITTMIQRMKDSTIAMRRGHGFPFAGFLYGDDSDEGETFQWDEALHSHWREFCDSLFQYRHYLNQCPDNHDFGVYLCNIELLEAPNQCSLLEIALKGVPFKDLTLHYNNSGYRLVNLVASVMKNNRQCEQLSLVGNQFEGTDDFTLGVYNRFWDTISDHPSLRRLNLSNCFNGSITGICHPALLSDAIPKLSNLAQIELKDNRITGEKVTFIANFLRNNTCLVELDLSGNPINDEDAGVIADALASNNTLQFAMVYGSPGMTEIGARALRKAVYDETSLNSIVDSNHVCHIKSYWDLTECNSKRDPKENRKRKLLRAFHRNRMLAAPDLIDRGLPEEKGGLAQKLMPLVLELVQDSFYGDTSSLSLVYTIIPFFITCVYNHERLEDAIAV